MVGVSCRLEFARWPVMNFSELASSLRDTLASERMLLRAFWVAAPVTTTLYFLLGPSSWLLLLGTAVCVSLLVLASAHWIREKVRLLRKRRIATWATVLFRVSVAFIAAIPARHAVALATGLPPQDFELSVALVTGVLYVPVSFGVVWAALVVVAAVQLIFAVLLQFVAQLSNPLYGFSGSVRAWATRQLEESSRFCQLGFGTLLLSVPLAIIFGLLTILIVNQSPFVRLTAFFADYQSMPNYPCLTTGQRARLHENGVVSIATLNALDVAIRVEVLDAEKCLLEHR